MKKLIALLVVALFTTATFAQTDATPAPAPKADQKATETKPAQDMAAKPAARMPHECYSMKDGQLMHCTGDKMEAQKEAVTLKNGTTLTPSGEMKMKDGTASKLENGQCVTMMGSVGDCEKMHSSMKPAPKVDQKK